ncbi:L,D-transpeptidase [Komarekiella sp. 'clone 1']|uniref:L,D-transpeptidase n=1 Tax=Komarekiella delphini-convector SJRDD-AB1 TaxID=2593771 RepID=A0AA40SVH6_9NOST|nr:L,D-transpeptidase [Komarekiella delphini-convector]MBD6616054.1 L,D-transpeptidase [Komarekiella delphini-convector SJRDD-AB1]
MAMVRNESVGRMVMMLCFGTAILSLAVHWRITSAEPYLGQPASASLRRDANPQGSRPKAVYGNLSQVGLGDTLSKSVSTKRVTDQEASKSNSAISKNVATTNLPSKTRLVAPAQKDHKTKDSWPKSLLAQALPQQKTSNQKTSVNTQVVVDLSDRRAYVYAKDEVIASYPIAIGKKGWETPTGDFQVMHMQHHPIWRHPITGKVFEAGTDSPLGDRWIGFWSDGRNHIGFHGTPEVEVIGTAVSHGCLRMRNPDVRMLYEQIKVGTTVIVRD